MKSTELRKYPVGLLVQYTGTDPANTMRPGEVCFVRHLEYGDNNAWFCYTLENATTGERDWKGRSLE